MSRQYILIPKEFYNSLMSNTRPNMEFSQNLVDKTLRNRKMDASTKNALLNQRMLSHLKNKKREEERPVRVAFDDQTMGSLINPNSFSTLNNSTLAQTLEKTPLEKTPHETPTSAEPPNTFPNSPATIADDSFFMNTPKRKMASPYQALSSFVKQNRDKFNIETSGKILNDNNKPIAGSDYLRTLDYIRRGQVDTNAPPGGKHLIKRMWKDASTKPLLEKLLHVKSPPAAQRTRSKAPSKSLNIEIWK